MSDQCSSFPSFRKVLPAFQQIASASEQAVPLLIQLLLLNGLLWVVVILAVYTVTFFLKWKVKQSHYRPCQTLRVPGDWGSQILRQSAHEGYKVVSPTHRPPLLQQTFLVLISVRGGVDPRAIVRPEGLCHWKIPMTLSGIVPATFWFVAECLDHCATACPYLLSEVLYCITPLIHVLFISNWAQYMRINHIHQLLAWSRVFPKNPSGSQLVKTIPAFNRIWKFIAASQKPTTCPCLEPDHYSSLSIRFLKILLILSPSTLEYFKWFVFLRFPPPKPRLHLYCSPYVPQAQSTWFFLTSPQE
jgi:hypothetical protein